MPNLSIKDVPEELAERLRQRAARHHRSLQGELMSILHLAMAPADPLAQPAESTVRSTDDQAGTTLGSKTSEEIAAQLRHRWPEPLDTGARAADILRRERDAR